MTDIRDTIIPKSDQLNADDLIGVSKTIKITKVSLLGDDDQPVGLNYEGDGGKPYKPCKSMRRVLVNVWGGDGAAYVGRSLTLYRDDKVTFGSVAVGGIRISHMSHIAKDVTMALTATRAVRRPYTVKPLPEVRSGSTDAPESQGKQATSDVSRDDVGQHLADALYVEAKDNAREGTEAFRRYWSHIGQTERDSLRTRIKELQVLAETADAADVEETDTL